MSGGINSADGLTEVESTGTGTVTSVSVATANGFSGSVATPTTTPAITLSMSSEGILAALAALDETAVFGGMATFTAVGAGPGEYTLAKSGIVVKNADGVEVLRIWATDPDGDNYNSENLYLGAGAGANQPTDNVSAGYQNTGIGFESLFSITEGYSNTGIGGYSLFGVTTGTYNTCVGAGIGQSITTGSGNVMLGGDFGFVVTGNYNLCIGHNSGPTDDVSNTIAVGYSAHVTASNRAVIGNDSVADTYFGSETGASKLHGKADALVFPDADPHVAGAAYWVAGVLTKSAG